MEAFRGGVQVAGLVATPGGSLGQTVEKPKVQSGKTVPREFPRAQPKGTPEGLFFQAV